MSIFELSSMVVFLLTAILSLVVGLLALRRPGLAGSSFLALLMLAVATWSFSSAMLLSASSPPARQFWAGLEYTGIAVTPALWLAFLLNYTGQGRRVTRRNLLLGLALPFVSVLLAWTNPLHGLVWRQMQVSPVVYGPWFWVQLAYTGLLVFAGLVRILSLLYSSLPLYRGPALALLFGSLAPWMAYAIFLSSGAAPGSFELAPILLMLFGAAIAWGFYYHRTIDIVPFRHSSITEMMEEGVIVVNRRNRVVDLNPAAERLTGVPAAQAIWRPLASLLPGWSEVSGSLEGLSNAYAELELQENGQRQVYGVHVSRLEGANDFFRGRLIILRNITEKKQQEEQLQQLNRMLKVLSAGSQAVARAVREEDLAVNVCELLVRTGGYRMVWLGVMEDQGRIRPVTYAGDERGYLSSTPFLSAGPDEGPAAQAAISGQAGIYNRIEAEPDNENSWRSQAAARGYAAAISLPLRSDGHPLGALTIYSAEADHFQPQIAGLLLELADNLAYGIQLLRSREAARLASEALRESEEKYRTLFEASVDAILVEALDGRILDANSAACSLFGYSREELGRLRRGDLIPAEGVESLPGPFSKSLGDADVVVETLAKKKDGQLFQSRVSTQIATIEGATVVIVYVRDITAQKAVEEQNRQKAAHDRILAQVAARLTARLDLSAVLKTVCAEIARALDLSAVVLGLYDPNHPGTFSQVSEYGLSERPQQTIEQLAIACTGGTTLEDVAISRFPQLQSQIPAAGVSLPGETEAHACIHITLKRNEELIGELSGYTLGESRRFTQAEIELFHALGDQAAQAIVNARLYEESQRRLRQVQSLHAIDLEIAASMDLFVTLHVLLVHITSQLEVDSAAILLFNSSEGPMEFAAGCGFRTRQVERSLLYQSQDFANQAVELREIVYAPGLFQKNPEQLQPLQISHSGEVTLLVAPLISKGAVKGVLELYSYDKFQPDPEWMEFLESFANLAAITIDNAQLFNDLQNKNVELGTAYNATIAGWSGALELRDKETQGHTQRVADLTMKLARAMRIPEAELVHIHRGALLHDIGKMAIPDSILLKPGDLTESEWKVMRRHPVIAYELLSPITYLRPALDIPYCHHEHWDGSGYPRGLKGEQIPLAARIFTVIDVWDALLSDRPYRPDWSVREAYEYIRDHAGTYFDPNVVKVFLDLLEELGALNDLDFSQVRRPSSV